MKCLRPLLFVLLLFSFVSQSLFCRTITEENYQKLMTNLNEQEKKIELLDSQLLMLTLQLESANKQLENSENSLKKVEESLKNANSKYKQRIICTSIFTFVVGFGLGCVITNKIELHCKTK